MQLWYSQCYGDEVKPDKFKTDLFSQTGITDSEQLDSKLDLEKDVTSNVSAAANDALSLISSQGGSSNYCPFNDFTAHILSVSVNVPLSDYCPLISIIRACFLMMAYMIAGSIILRAISEA
jgi:hypothetical protein